MIGITVKADFRGIDKAHAEFKKYSNKSVEDIGRKSLFEVSRLATSRTAGRDKSLIESELRHSTPSGAPLAAILVNKKRGQAGKKGFYGPKMTQRVEGYIKRAKNSANFLRAGWLSAVKAIAPFVQSKSGAAPIPAGIRTKNKLGGANPGRIVAGKYFGSVWNSVAGGTGEHSRPDKVNAIITLGLQAAIDAKTADLWVYINRKQKEIADRFNNHR